MALIRTITTCTECKQGYGTVVQRPIRWLCPIHGLQTIDIAELLIEYYEATNTVERLRFQLHEADQTIEAVMRYLRRDEQNG